MIEKPAGETWKIIPLTDPDRRMVIMRRSDGLFFFVEECFWHAVEEYEVPEHGWQAEHQSGIFASAELAEAEIRATTLRGQVVNS